MQTKPKPSQSQATAKAHPSQSPNQAKAKAKPSQSFGANTRTRDVLSTASTVYFLYYLLRDGGEFYAEHVLGDAARVASLHKKFLACVCSLCNLDAYG